MNANTETRALTVRSPAALDPTAFEPENFEQLLQMGRMLVASRLFPHVQTPEAAAVIAMQGRALGLSAIQALNGIYTVHNRTGLSANLIVALVRRSPSCRFFRCVESTEDQATWETLRTDDAPDSTPRRWTFTWKDAETAGYTKYWDKDKGAWAPKDNWVKQRKLMLVNRAATMLAKMEYAEVLWGMESTEDLEDQATTAAPVMAKVVSEEPAAAAPASKVDQIRSRLGALKEQPAAAEVEVVSEGREGPVTEAGYTGTATAAREAERYGGGDELSPKAELIRLQNQVLAHFEGDVEAARLAWNASLPAVGGLNDQQAKACLSKAKTLTKKLELAKQIRDLAADLRELSNSDYPTPKEPWVENVGALEAIVRELTRKVAEAKR